MSVKTPFRKEVLPKKSVQVPYRVYEKGVRDVQRSEERVRHLISEKDE